MKEDKIWHVWGEERCTIEGKIPLWLPRFRRQDNIKIYHKEIRWGDVNWIYLEQDRDKWRILVNTVVDLVNWFVSLLVISYFASWVKSNTLTCHYHYTYQVSPSRKSCNNSYFSSSYFSFCYVSNSYLNLPSLLPTVWHYIPYTAILRKCGVLGECLNGAVKGWNLAMRTLQSVCLSVCPCINDELRV